MARLAGFEPTTPWFVAKYSIQLSYRRDVRIIAEASHRPLAGRMGLSAVLLQPHHQCGNDSGMGHYHHG